MMSRNDLLAGLWQGSANRLALPEYRQIELYTKKKSLAFAPEEAPSPVPVPLIAGACRAFLMLEAFLGLGEVPSWQGYLSLPRATATQKLVAELYRILRVARKVAFHPQGHVEAGNGIVRLNGAIDRVALSLEITAAGLTLLESAVAWYLQAQGQPYPDAYAEAMLSEYFTDIVAEIKRFADEDRVLYQFRRKFPFNRHFRFDCDNPRLTLADGLCRFEIGAIHSDPARTPIDFYVTHADRLHIVPVEALEQGALPLADFPRWQARLDDGQTLPPWFRARFAREAIVAGIPMT